MSDSSLKAWTESLPEFGVLMIGSSDGLAALGRLLQAPAESVLELDDTKPPEAYTSAAKHLRIRIELESGMTIQRDGDDVVFAGDAKSLGILGENVARFAEGDLGPHVHIEYFPENGYLRPDAEPLTLKTVDERH